MITYRNVSGVTINFRLAEGRRFVVAPNKTFDATEEQAAEIDAMIVDPDAPLGVARVL